VTIQTRQSERTSSLKEASLLLSSCITSRNVTKEVDCSIDLGSFDPSSLDHFFSSFDLPILEGSLSPSSDLRSTFQDQSEILSTNNNNSPSISRSSDLFLSKISSFLDLSNFSSFNSSSFLDLSNHNLLNNLNSLDNNSNIDSSNANDSTSSRNVDDSNSGSSNGSDDSSNLDGRNAGMLDVDSLSSDSLVDPKASRIILR